MRPAIMDNPPPLITLTTDFGTRDPYVAAVKGVLLRYCPGARLVDLSHEIAPHDVLEGALFLAAALPAFAAAAVHFVVVDPGVGGARRALAARLRPQAGEASGPLVVCPDNGLLTLLVRSPGVAEARSITSPAFRRESLSPTFHGRDLFAVAAARLAAGEPLAATGPPVTQPVELPIAEPQRLEDGTLRGAVIHLDRFGNAITNLTVALLEAERAERAEQAERAIELWCGGHTLPLVRTYADAAPGEPLALIGSSGLLEIAVREGSAAARLALARGSAVELRRARLAR